MKVVFFSSTGRSVGGAVVCLKKILLYCLDHDIKPFVILRSKGDFEIFLNENKIPYEIVKYHDWLRPSKDHGGLKNELKWRIKDIQNVFAERKAYRILERERPDIYHINVIYNPCGARSAHKLRIPVIWHLREFVEINDDTPFFRNREKAYSLIARSSSIVCVSECIKEYYGDHLPQEKLIRIYDGVSVPEEEIVIRSIDNPVRITLSGGAKVKGHVDLIRAIKVLTDKGIKNIEVTIAGRFADQKYLQALQQMVEEYKLSSLIKFIGHQKDMDAIWNKTDIAVVCSRFESFGLSVCEAMVRGIPVVCAKSTGTYEVTDNGTLASLYDIGNYEQLAEKLHDIMNNYATVAAKSVDVAKTIQKRFNVSNSSKAIVELYRILCASSDNSK